MTSRRGWLSLVVGVLLVVAIAVPGRAHAGVAPRSAFVPVLIYHHVKWNKPSDDAIERGLTVPPTQFRAELSYLAAHRYHTVTAAQLVSFLRGGGPLPSRPVVISFDDGYTDMYPDVYPLLLKLHMRATFFIVAGFLDTPRYLTWKQVEVMSAHGMDVEAHTMTHPDLQLVNDARLVREVGGSRQALVSRLHRPVRVFCYPYGAFDARIEREVVRAGFYAAFTTQQGWWQRSDRLLTLPRVYVDNDDTLAIFAGRLTADPSVLAQDPT